VTYEGQVKVVDFGIAKAVGRASETRHGIIKGKVPYMAPEQASGQVVDRRVDIFSVGVMLWEVAVGARLWQGAKEVDILRSLIHGNIPSSPREANASVSPEIDAICRKALAYKLEDRYATAADFQTDLDKVIAAGGGRPGARDLGKVVADAFADKRDETKATIETQLAKLRRETGDSFRPVKIPQPPSSSTTDAVEFSGDEISVLMSNEPTEEQAPSSEVAVLRNSVPEGTLPSESSVRRNRIAVLGTVALGALVVIGAALAATARKPSTGSAGLASGDPSAKGSVGAQDQITASFRADPPEAKFSIDGAEALSNPFTGHFPRDGAKHRLSVFAPGYLMKTEELTFDDDQSLQLSLARDSLHPKKP
jgi:serine/threonine-protein kinase